MNPRYSVVFFLLFTILIIAATHFGLWQWAHSHQPALYRVVDGDTFHIKDDRIRIAGFDAPEKGEPGYKEASARLAQLLSSGKVTIRPVARDKYGRTIAKVFVEGQDVSELMKASGHQKGGRH